MPFEKFNRNRINLLPLNERIHDVDLKEVLIDPLRITTQNANSDITYIAEKIKEAREEYDATVMMMYGGHVIRTGNALCMIELMKKRYITHFATNGAGSIHDFEFALIGKTCESVAKYISEGQFGLWKETGLMNEAIKQGAKDNLGWGEAIGRYIWENNFPYRESSVLAMGYKLGVPCTVHVGIGNDIIHEHPNCDGASMGICTYNDFLIYTQSISNLEQGVFLNFGSAVTGPEVYLKALSMARNVAKQEGKSITNFLTAVFDIQPIINNNYHQEPAKNDARYYFRPWKTILARTVADGGESRYICGDHKVTIPQLTNDLLSLS